MKNILFAVIAMLAVTDAFASIAKQDMDNIISEAVKAATAKAADPVEALHVVMVKRMDWSPMNICAVYSAILDSSNLKDTFLRDLNYFTYGLKQDLPGVKLLTALKQECSKLHDGTFEAVITQMVLNSNEESVNAARNVPQFSGPNANMPGLPSRDKRPFPVPVTPDPISSQN